MNRIEISDKEKPRKKKTRFKQKLIKKHETQQQK